MGKKFTPNGREINLKKLSELTGEKTKKRRR